MATGIPHLQLQLQRGWDIRSRGFARIGILAFKTVLVTFMENCKQQHHKASLNCVSARESKLAKADDHTSARVN